MRKCLLFVGLVGMLASLTGCHRPLCRNCQPGGDCGPGGCGCNSSHYNGCRPTPLSWQSGGLDYAGKMSYRDVRNEQVNPGPPNASYGNPYYTVRGPRDFLLDNPPSIGR